MNEETLPGHGRASEIPGRNDRSLTESAPETQRQRFRVEITRELWRRCTVTIEPRSVAHPSRTFRTHTEALVFAEQLAALNGGWPLIDRVGGDG